MNTLSRTCRAFTLIEAAVVMFLIGMLALTATAAMGGQTAQSNDRMTQADIDAAIDAAFGVMITDGMVTADLVRLGDEAPSLAWLGADVTPDEAGEVSIAAASLDDSVGIASKTQGGACWYALVRFSARPGTAPRVFAVAPPGSRQPCTGSHALTLSEYSDLDYSPGSTGTSWRNPVLLGTAAAPG
jgi:type II secretory pathway pseudopilin PulG